LHLTEVAELHSDSSHAVLPTRADGDFSSPKFAPSTKTKLEPENKIRALRVTCNGQIHIVHHESAANRATSWGGGCGGRRAQRCEGWVLIKGDALPVPG
jgi:hypothetical protein